MSQDELFPDVPESHDELGEARRRLATAESALAAARADQELTSEPVPAEAFETVKEATAHLAAIEARAFGRLGE